VGLAVLLPLGAAVGVLALVDWAWVLLAGLLLFGCAGVPATRAREEVSYRWSSGTATRLLERLCMRADVPVPQLVVEHGRVPNVWMARGRIHVTSPVLGLLDDGELEAVLAHEVAHVALTWPFVLMWILAVLCVPPSFVIGWISRLSVLGMSRPASSRPTPPQ
jgi:Zn-dependent protease with chaperone function